DRLVEDTALKTAIDTLTHQKRQGLELERGPRIPVISEFLEHQLARLKGRHAKAPARISAEVLDQLFQETLVEIYGNRIV
ncbi:MAG: nucleotidyltransferase domain-containing protein, partial [Candidatus Hydrogenedentes bacterium]|nr:nucleotidyltransferase domain-containing protein [Candidatus Hydrogenedentota bacterium]